MADLVFSKDTVVREKLEDEFNYDERRGFLNNISYMADFWIKSHGPSENKINLPKALFRKLGSKN